MTSTAGTLETRSVSWGETDVHEVKCHADPTWNELQDWLGFHGKAEQEGLSTNVTSVVDVETFVWNPEAATFVPCHMEDAPIEPNAHVAIAEINSLGKKITKKDAPTRATIIDTMDISYKSVGEDEEDVTAWIDAKILILDREVATLETNNEELQRANCFVSFHPCPYLEVEDVAQVACASHAMAALINQLSHQGAAFDTLEGMKDDVDKEEREQSEKVVRPRLDSVATEANAKMAMAGIVRVLQVRSKKHKDPLAVADIETEFKALWKMPLNLAQAGETDLLSFLKKWPSKVEIAADGLFVKLAA